MPPAEESYEVPERALPQRPHAFAGFFAEPNQARPEPHPDDVGEGEGGWIGVGELIEAGDD